MDKLRVAILHYHLRGGGVTRVIEHTFGALQPSKAELCVITGETPSDTTDIPKNKVGVVEGLSYGEENPERNPDEMLREVQEQAADLLGEEPDVWHIHNHSLGKNAAATQVFLKLAAELQSPILFHIHDFAEDNRPKNYQYLADVSGSFGKKNLVEELYPQASHIHYGVLNGRDLRFLKQAGIKKERLHILSNPVDLDMPEIRTRESSIYGKVYLYPCRVIPRKNIGEFVLWSALAEKNEQFAVTLAPKNPKYHESYNKWKQFVQDHDLPVVFEAGKVWDMSFPELLNRADGFVSTSIAEGFGLIYLESWLAGKPLAGRLLPKIVADFKDKGIRFPGMYDRLYIPADWLGKEKLKERFEEAILGNLDKYGMKVSTHEIKNWVRKLIPAGKVDFGSLDRPLQQQVIELLLEQPELGKSLKPHNLWRMPVEQETLRSNKAIVKSEFSLQIYGERLMDRYQILVRTSPDDLEFLDADLLLRHFQSPENFSLIRT